jgi:hypothetical protein
MGLHQPGDILVEFTARALLGALPTRISQCGASVKCFTPSAEGAILPRKFMAIMFHVKHFRLLFVFKQDYGAI